MGGGDSAGGSYGLAQLIDQHGECILADFQSHYGLNFVDVMRSGSGYSPSLVLSYIRQLPLDSRTVASIRGGNQFDGWDTDRYLTAALIDAVNQTTYAVVAGNSGKKKPKPPKPVPRPDKNTGPKRDDKSNPFRQQLAAARRSQGG